MITNLILFLIIVIVASSDYIFSKFKKSEKINLALTVIGDKPEKKSKKTLYSKSYILILVSFSVLLLASIFIDRSLKPTIILSESTVIFAFIVLYTLFSINAIINKYKFKQIVAREILYLFFNVVLAIIMFGAHILISGINQKTLKEIDSVLSNCNVDSSNKEIFVNKEKKYSNEYLSELGFEPEEKEFYVHIYSDFISKTRKRWKTSEDFIIVTQKNDLEKFIKKIGKDKYDSLINSNLMNKPVEVLSLKKNKEDKVFINDSDYRMNSADEYLLGEIDFIKKSPVFDNQFVTFNVGKSERSFKENKEKLIKLGVDITKSRHFKNRKFIYRQEIGGNPYYGICLWDKFEHQFVLKEFKWNWTIEQYASQKSIDDCDFFLCRKKTIRNNFFYSYTPFKNFNSPSVIEINNFDDVYDSIFYEKKNMIKLKSDWKKGSLKNAAINYKKDKIESSFLSMFKPKLYDNYDLSWFSIFFILAYAYRFVVSIIVLFVLLIRWSIRTYFT